jgi:hypothetical protein
MRRFARAKNSCTCWGDRVYIFKVKLGIADSSLRSFAEEEMTERQEKEKLRSRSFGNLSLFISFFFFLARFRDLERRDGGWGVGLIVVVKACIAVNAASL